MNDVCIVQYSGLNLPLYMYEWCVFFKPRTKSLILVAIKHCCIWWQVDSECVVYNGGSDEDSIRHWIRRAATEQGQLHRGSRWGTVSQVSVLWCHILIAKQCQKYHFSLISGRIIMFKYSLYMHLRYVLFMYLLLAWIWLCRFKILMLQWCCHNHWLMQKSHEFSNQSEQVSETQSNKKF